LIFSQLVLNFESERYLIGFAQVACHARSLAREKEIARHLHGDGAGPGPRTGNGVGIGHTQGSQPVDTRVVIKIGVLGGEDGLPHVQRNFRQLD